MLGLVTGEDRKLQRKYLKTNKIKYFDIKGKEITKRQFNKKDVFYSSPLVKDKGVLYEY